MVTPEGTPNPNALKFTLDRPAIAGGSATFRDGSDAAADPLGARIFGVGGVENVFTVSNFVSVTKSDDVTWDDVLPRVVAAIEAHFADGAA